MLGSLKARWGAARGGVGREEAERQRRHAHTRTSARANGRVGQQTNCGGDISSEHTLHRWLLDLETIELTKDYTMAAKVDLLNSMPTQ